MSLLTPSRRFEAIPPVWRTVLRSPWPPGTVAVFMITDDTGGRWLVDSGAGSPASTAALAETTRAWQRAGDGIRGVVLTHAHRDHAGGLEALEPPLVIAHGGASRTLGADGRLPEFARLETVVGARGTFDRIAGWQWIEARGHAPGHLMPWHPGTATLLSGDQFLLGLRAALRVADPDEDSLGGYLDTAARVAALEPRLMLPSHTEAITDPVPWLDRTAARLRRQVGRTLEALTAEPRGVEEIAAAAYRAVPSLPARELLWRELLASLRHLVFRGLARRDFDEGRERFRCA